MNLREAGDRDKLQHALRMLRRADADGVAFAQAHIDVVVKALVTLSGDVVMQLLACLDPGEPFFILCGSDPDAEAALRCFVRNKVMRDGVSDETTQAVQIAADMRTFRALAADRPAARALRAKRDVRWNKGNIA